MDWLTRLKKAAKSNTAIYIRFLQQYSVQNNSLHIFHEGKDDPSFYGNFIVRKTKKNQKVNYYNCHNKQNVYDNYSKINWSVYPKKRILFFVDKDYSDFLNLIYPKDTNIFVTKYYSIENYLVSEEIFERCLKDLIGLEDNVITPLSRKFKSALKDFHKELIVLSAFIIFHRLKNNKINLNQLNLQNIYDLSSFFEVKRKVNKLNEIDKQLGIKTYVCFSEVSKISKNLKLLKEPKLYIRGKYELFFLVHSINSVLKILNKGLKKPKYKIPISLSMSNAIQVIAPRVRQPRDVSRFLNSNLS